MMTRFPHKGAAIVRPIAKVIFPVVMLSVAGMVSGCTAPPGMQYKTTDVAPATPDLVQAYEDLAQDGYNNMKELLAADRYRHGIRPAIAAAPPEPSHDNALFDHYQSMYFKVYSVEVVDQYQAPASLDVREHLPVDPTEAVHSWASRLRPTGGVNKLQVIIKDAHMQHTDGAIQAASNQHYDAGMVIEMRICSRSGTVLSTVSSSSAQFADVNGAASTDARKAALNQTLMRMIDAINGDLESKMARNFSPYIDRAG